MDPFSSINFGLLIAYFLPGIISLYALKYFSTDVADLFAAVLDKDKNLGASLLILAASLAVGLIVSAFRDFALERIHYKTGVEFTPFNYGKFIEKDRKSALEDLIANKYRFYQFYGNTMVALLFLFIARFNYANAWEKRGLLIINVLAVILLFLASRDALKDMFNTYLSIVAEIDSESASPDKVSANYHVKLTVDGKLNS
jgi:hypothetical protein